MITKTPAKKGGTTKVTFELPAEYAGEQVCLCGDFNSWSAEAAPMTKRKDGRYRSGRNDNWVKVTCRHRQTFVLAGIAYNGRKFDGVYLTRELILWYKRALEAGDPDALAPEADIIRLAKSRGEPSKRTSGD